MSPVFKSLKSRQDFLILKSKSFYKCKYFIAQYQKSDASQESCYLGLTVSKKNGNAVRRNKIKRRLREAARIAFQKNPIPIKAYKINLIARYTLADVPFDKLVTEMQKFLATLA